MFFQIIKEIAQLDIEVIDEYNQNLNNWISLPFHYNWKEEYKISLHYNLVQNNSLQEQIRYYIFCYTIFSAITISNASFIKGKKNPNTRTKLC